MGDIVFLEGTEGCVLPLFCLELASRLFEPFKKKVSHVIDVVWYLWEKQWRERQKAKKANQKIIAGKERVNSCYACAHRTRRVGWDGRRLPGAMFSPEVSSLLRADAFPYLICPRPSPSPYAFWFLVGASWSQPRQWVCVWRTPSSLWPGDPLPALRLARRVVELARVPSPASAFPHLSPTHGGARLVAPQWCSAPGGSGDWLGCLLLPAGPKPEVVIRKELGSYGLGGDGGSAYVSSITCRILLPFREAG